MSAPRRRDAFGGLRGHSTHHPAHRPRTVLDREGPAVGLVRGGAGGGVAAVEEARDVEALAVGRRHPQIARAGVEHHAERLATAGEVRARVWGWEAMGACACGGLPREISP